MKASFFDVSLNAPDRGSGRSLDGTILFQGSRTAASVHVYTCPGIRGDEWARVATVRPLDVKWMDPFEFKSGDGRIEGRGIVLLPGSPDPKKMKTAKRRDLLERLSGGEREMILALAREKGVQGLRAPEISDFCRLSPSRIEAHARDLEAEDEIRILSFSPLCLVARIALDFLQDKVIEFLVRFHNSHPERKGAERDAIVARYGPPEIVLSLVVRTLEKDGRLRTDGRLFWLADFRVLLRAEDEEVLRRIERMLDRGELGTASFEAIRRQLRLSEDRLQTLLSILAERKKIVKGKDGFLVHSRWLDDVVAAVRDSGKKELTVAEFKAMTGLSRKYAIPLLELLDEMGITRRKGSRREIL